MTEEVTAEIEVEEEQEPQSDEIKTELLAEPDEPPQAQVQEHPLPFTVEPMHCIHCNAAKIFTQGLVKNLLGEPFLLLVCDNCKMPLFLLLPDAQPQQSKPAKVRSYYG